jgi:hypothetical protein
MPVDEIVDKIIHRPYTGTAQAVGKLVHGDYGVKRLIR